MEIKFFDRLKALKSWKKLQIRDKRILSVL